MIQRKSREPAAYLLALLVLLVSAMLFVFNGCAQKSEIRVDTRVDTLSDTEVDVGIESTSTFSITSPAFEAESKIPVEYTCDSADINPPLMLSGIPESAKSIVLILDDPDAPAGTWDHWVVWNIPAPISSRTIEGTMEKTEKTIEETIKIGIGILPEGAVQGRNSWNTNEYRGPCPPSGTHRYFFKAYAISSSIELPNTATKKDVEKVMQGKIIAKAELVGLYSRQR